MLAIAARFGALHAARSRADHLRVKADATRASADTILAKWTRADRGLGAATLEAVERRLIEEEAALAGLAGSVGRDHARCGRQERWSSPRACWTGAWRASDCSRG